MEFYVYCISALAVTYIRAAGGHVWPAAPRRGTKEAWAQVLMPPNTTRVDVRPLGFMFILPTDEVITTGTHNGMPTLDAGPTECDEESSSTCSRLDGHFYPSTSAW